MPEFFVWPFAFSIPLLIQLGSIWLRRRRARIHLRSLAGFFEDTAIEGCELTAHLGDAGVAVEDYGQRIAVKVTGGRWLPPGAELRTRQPNDRPDPESATWTTIGAELFWAALGRPADELGALAVVFSVRADGWLLIVPAEFSEEVLSAVLTWTHEAATLTDKGPDGWVNASLTRLEECTSPSTAAYLLHRLWPAAANDDHIRQNLERTLAQACAKAPADSWTVVARTVWDDLTAAA